MGTNSNPVMPISISLSGRDNPVAQEPNSLMFALQSRLIIFEQDTSKSLMNQKLQSIENNLS